MGKNGRSLALRLTTVVFLFAVFSVGWALAEDMPVSRSQIDNSEYDFGSVIQGTKVVHDFVLKNVGNADLVIQRIVPACGCTAATVSTEPIKPGQQTLVHVEFSTSGFSGEKYKTIRLYTNDFETPSQLLALKGIVEQNVSILPASVFFEDVARGTFPDGISQEVEIKVRAGSGITISAVRSYSRFLEIRELDNQPGARRFQVVLSPLAPEGELRDKIIVELSGGQERSLNIPVFARIKSKLSFSPAQISFGILEGGSPIMRAVAFDNLGDDSINILGIRSSHPAVEAKYKIIQPGKKFVIQVTVDPDKVIKELRACIEISTDSADEREASLNVYGIVPPKVVGNR